MNLASEAADSPVMAAIDFSTVSKSLVDYAARVALTERKPLRLVYVLPPNPDDSYRILQLRKEELSDTVAKASAEWRSSGLSVSGVFAMGAVAPELIHIGNRLNACYMIIGTAGPAGLERHPVGSVAEAVIRKSNRPVLVLGPAALRRERKTLPWKHLLLACETSRQVMESALLAGNMAQQHQATLTIFSIGKSGLKNLPKDRLAMLERLMSREAWLTVQPRCAIREGEPAAEMVRLVEEMRADLLLLSVRSGSALLTDLRRGILGEVLRSARCPAMTLWNRRDRHTAWKVLPPVDPGSIDSSPPSGEGLRSGGNSPFL